MEKYITFISYAFFLFVAACVLLYYVVPIRFRWTVLLIASVAFYLQCGIVPLVAVLLTAAISFFAALLIEKTDKKDKKKRRLFVSVGIIIVLAALVFTKIYTFAKLDISWFIVPVGISYYSFSIISYLADVMDERLGKNTFDLSTSGQKLDTSFLLIKEAVSLYNIEHIYLELSYDIAINTEKTYDQLTSTYLATDYMRPSFERTKYLLGVSSEDYYANSFLFARRDWEKLFDFKYVTELIEAKDDEKYKSYDKTALDTYDSVYGNKGFVISKDGKADGTFILIKGFEAVDVSEISEAYNKTLLGIIDYCKNKGVELTLIATPVSSYLSVARGNYDEYIDYINNLTEATGVEYIDFNLVKEDFFEDTSMYFMDDNHLNNTGADKLSNLLADVILGEVTAQDILYPSVSEKFETIEPTLYGIAFKPDTETKTRSLRIISNRDEEMEYQIILTDDDGNEEVIQDFSTNKEFVLDLDKTGICTVNYRLGGDSKILTHKYSIKIYDKEN